MDIMDKNKLNEINRDAVFFFFLVITSLISLYIIIEKKKILFNINNFNKNELNKLFRFNRYFIIFIDIYFVINAYNALIEFINNNEDEETIKEQFILLVANVFFLIGALLYIPLTNSDSIITR